MAIEGLGEAVTGGMIARAIEPEAGESIDESERTCLNCGAALAGPYCSQCGQKGHVHRSLRGFGHDLLHSVFHFEGKIWRTLPMLAWRPGDLTRRYIDGERARFVSPIALFLFSVFLMFAVFSTLGGPFQWSTNTQALNEARQDMLEELGQRSERIAGLERQRRWLAARGRPTEALDRQLADLRRDQAVVATAQRIQTTTTSEGGLTRSEAIDLDDLQVNTGWPWFDQAVRHAAENPALLAYKLQSSAYKFSWAADPAVGAVRLDAVPVAPRLQALRPHRVRHLLDRVHDPADGRAERGPDDPRQRRDLEHGHDLHPALAHVPAAARRLPPAPVQRDLADGVPADLRRHGGDSVLPAAADDGPAGLEHDPNRLNRIVL